MSENTTDHVILPCGHEVLHADQVHYCTYIGLDQLTALMSPFPGSADQREFFLHPDEHQFLLIHQVSEMAFAQCYFDLLRAIAFVEADEIAAADHALTRVIAWMKTIPNTMRVLATMKPEDFAVFRMQLAPASGAESIMYRRLEIRSGLRPDSPFATHVVETSENVMVEKVFMYREFLDRAPGTGENDPRMRWWTAELTELSQKSSLASAFDEYLVRQCMSYESLDEYVLALKTTDVLAKEVPPVIRPLAEFMNRLHEYELCFRSFRSGHAGVAEKQIGKSRGTGHTSGYPYLRSTHDIAKFFPAICALYEVP